MKRILLSTVRFALGVAVSGALTWVVVRGLDWETVGSSLKGISLPLLLLSLIIFLSTSYLRAVRWQFLFLNGEVSTQRLFVVQNVGLGLNNILPFRVASKVVQLAMLSTRDRLNGATALAALTMERVVDMIVTTLILGTAFFMVPEMKNFTLYIWGAIGFAVVSVTMLSFIAWNRTGLGFIRRFRFAYAFAGEIARFQREHRKLTASLAVSLAYWLMMGLTAWTIALALGLSISPVTATLVTLGSIFFATAVPAGPAAIGAVEFAIVYVLGYFGVEREASLGFAVVTHAVFFLPPTILAAVFLPREGVVSMRGLRGLTLQRAGASNIPGC